MTKRGWTLSAAAGLFSFGALIGPALAEDRIEHTGKQLDEAADKVDDSAKETTTTVKTKTETTKQKSKAVGDKAKDESNEQLRKQEKKLDQIDDSMK